MNFALMGEAAVGLAYAPFLGAWRATQAELARPQPASLAELVRDDVRLYFAPFTGAAQGVRDELARLSARHAASK
jgi:hypothetical protein